MKTIAYSNPFVPAEWIAAHGLRPGWMRLRSSDGGPLVDAVQGVCPYARAVLHQALSDTEASAVVLTTTCDQMRHAEALLTRNSDRPVFLLNVPSTWETDAAKQLYLDELRRLGRFLVQLGGAAPSPDDLARVMLQYESARGRLRAVRCRLSARQFAQAAAAIHRDRTAVPDAPDGSPKEAGIPLAIVGGPLIEDDYAMLDLVEQAGGRVVLNATEGGERTMPAAFDRQRLTDDPVTELARAYFGSIPAVFRRPNSGLYEWLERELPARKVRGVLLRRYVWCDLWHAELYRLKQWSPVPVLDIDVCHDDSALSRAAGRTEAFLEMLR